LTGKFVTGTSAKASRLPASKRATDILTSSNFEQLERLTAFAAAHGHTILELAFGYLLTELILSAVLVSASTPAQLKQDAGAIGWRLSSDERASLLDMLPPMPTGQPKT
jgi:aryl-alcohol dehydrogenase-like predicted oxidoreductase